MTKKNHLWIKLFLDFILLDQSLNHFLVWELSPKESSINIKEFFLRVLFLYQILIFLIKKLFLKTGVPMAGQIWQKLYLYLRTFIFMKLVEDLKIKKVSV